MTNSFQGIKRRTCAAWLGSSATATDVGSTSACVQYNQMEKENMESEIVQGKVC